MFNLNMVVRVHCHGPAESEHHHHYHHQWRTKGGWGLKPLPPAEIPKALQNRAKLNPIVKTVKNF